MCLLNIFNVLCVGSRGTRSSQMDSHSSSSNYHDSWETRSSYPERDRYPERDARDQARDASFERRHGERDRRDNRERGWSDSHMPFSAQQLGGCSSNLFQVTANMYDLDSILGSIFEAIHIIFGWCKKDYVISYQHLINRSEELGFPYCMWVIVCHYHLNPCSQRSWLISN